MFLHQGRNSRIRNGRSIASQPPSRRPWTWMKSKHLGVGHQLKKQYHYWTTPSLRVGGPQLKGEPQRGRRARPSRSGKGPRRAPSPHLPIRKEQGGASRPIPIVIMCRGPAAPVVVQHHLDDGAAARAATTLLLLPPATNLRGGDGPSCTRNRASRPSASASPHP